MKDINVKIKINSLDSSVEFDAIGEFKNNRIKFVDPEGDVNYIIKHKDTIEYYKKGQVDMKYKYDLDAVTKGYYSIAHNKFEFDIVTNIMTIEDEHIYIKYDLYQSNELVNQTELYVGYQVKEES
jgi:uncharacterized beta-barrel protein YwiB (DUF1934 family)